MKIKIPLNYSRADFEEIYFGNHQGNYIRSELIKSEFKYTVIATVALIVAIVYSLFYEFYNHLIFFGIVFLFALFNYIKAFRKLYKWKSQVFQFLNKQDKVKNNVLILTDNSLSVIQDEKVNIEKWTNFSCVEISDQYILLHGKERYIFPCNSLSVADYQILKEIISSKVKQPGTATSP